MPTFVLRLMGFHTDEGEPLSDSRLFDISTTRKFQDRDEARAFISGFVCHPITVHAVILAEVPGDEVEAVACQLTQNAELAKQVEAKMVAKGGAPLKGKAVVN